MTKANGALLVFEDGRFRPLNPDDDGYPGGGGCGDPACTSGYTQTVSGGDTNFTNTTDGISISAAQFIVLQGQSVELIPEDVTGHVAFYGGTDGLIMSERPSIATQAGTVSVAAFNALRTAMIKLGVILDGD